jgi:hypothetical protein
MKRPYIVLSLLVLFLSGGCGLGSLPVVGGLFATATPTPTSTLTPSATPSPTLTPTITPSPTPTLTPTVTPTPGPVTFHDDFSQANIMAWSACEKCALKDGRLMFGPFEPKNNMGEQFNVVICESCGEHVYYRESVDVSYISGPTDRFYGLIAGVTIDPENTLQRVVYLGISTWQVYVIRDYAYKDGILKELNSNLTGYLNPGVAANHIEIAVKPSAQPNLVDIYFTMNNGVIYVLYSQPAVPTKAGFGMSFHSMTVAYDNYAYEELPAK